MSRWVQVVLITSRGQKLNRNLDKAKVFGFLETPPANLYKCNFCLFQIGCIIFPGVFLFQIGCIIFPGVLIFLIDCIILGFPFSLRQNFPESDESVLAYSSSEKNEFGKYEPLLEWGQLGKIFFRQNWNE